MVERCFMRVAHPLEQWDGTMPLADVAVALAKEQSWSLFVRVDHLDPETVLGAFYGWRTGPGPLGSYSYLVFTEPELLLSEGTLLCTPDHFTHGWPIEVRDAHYDLESHTARGAKTFVEAVGPMSARLVSTSRESILLVQHRLTLREDAPDKFKTQVHKRLNQLELRESAVMAALRRLAVAANLPPP